MLFSGFFIASFSQNLVLNPGFETWSKITKPASWITAESCSKDSVSVYAGSYSCKQTGVTGYTKSLSQTIAVTPGNQYRFSFYFKTETTGTGHGCRIWCNWKDASGTNITDAASKLILQPSTYMKSDSWQLYSLEIIAPANASFFDLEVRTYQYSIAYWDDFIFEENVATDVPEKLQEDIKIYPNPAHNYLIISNLYNLQRIDIQDLAGRCVWSFGFPGEKSIIIPVSGLARGLYIIKIKRSDRIITRKFIKE